MDLYKNAFNKQRGIFTGESDCSGLFYSRLRPEGNGVFSYKAGQLMMTLWYKKMGGVWYWSPDQDTWMKCPNLVVSSGTWKDQKPAKVNQDFIRWLGEVNPPEPVPFRMTQSAPLRNPKST